MIFANIESVQFSIKCFDSLNPRIYNENALKEWQKFYEDIAEDQRVLKILAGAEIEKIKKSIKSQQNFK